MFPSPPATCQHQHRVDRPVLRSQLTTCNRFHVESSVLQFFSQTRSWRQTWTSSTWVNYWSRSRRSLVWSNLMSPHRQKEKKWNVVSNKVGSTPLKPPLWLSQSNLGETKPRPVSVLNFLVQLLFLDDWTTLLYFNLIFHSISRQSKYTLWL